MHDNSCYTAWPCTSHTISAQWEDDKTSHCLTLRHLSTLTVSGWHTLMCNLRHLSTLTNSASHSINQSLIQTHFRAPTDSGCYTQIQLAIVNHTQLRIDVTCLCLTPCFYLVGNTRYITGFFCSKPTSCILGLQLDFNMPVGDPLLFSWAVWWFYHIVFITSY